eukprot:TRINITY_DN740_c0_g1_i1.p2 TRINITY_DN740_c0_g1~~TRINITY_DN740_c0_g1_i1.p2  ORF type:complete len:264 (+),score=53.27 TRINITY_DN740_c0_g1_i1:2676-3467(+)
MFAAAFVSSFCPAIQPSQRFELHATNVVTPRHRCVSRRRVRMNTEPENTAPEPPKRASTVDAPSFDTEIFSNFVDSAQQKIDDLQQSIQQIDTTKLVDDTKQASLALVDNFLAGDWLNRGELYGVIQLAFVLFLLRGGGLLDLLVNFLAGPALFIVGATISAKSVFDLGPKQLSIWPAPVPEGDLRTEGVYQYVRHPMYAGVLLASAGFAVATASPSRLALTIAFGAFLMKKIDVEEQFLKDSYPEYEQYTQQVLFKLIPNVF